MVYRPNSPSKEINVNIVQSHKEIETTISIFARKSSYLIAVFPRGPNEPAIIPPSIHKITTPVGMEIKR